MKRENIHAKKSILKRIPEEDYNGMINMITDDIYNNVEYDVIILLARKFSKFYRALLPLAKEEYDGYPEQEHMKISEDSRPIIITSQALDWVIWSIRTKNKDEKCKIRRILLADDIFIHGRTLLRVKKRLEEEFKKAEVSDFQVDIIAYAVNDEESLVQSQDIKNWDKIQKCTKSNWKILSDEIVDIIYLMRQTYTSYVPNARFKIESEEGRAIADFLQKNKVQRIENNKTKEIGITSYFYLVKGTEQYKICESFRIYKFDIQQEYVLVPMISIRLINEECLNRYIGKLIEEDCLFCNDNSGSLQEFLLDCSGEYKYRLFLYVMSAFAGWKFMQDIIGIKTEWNYDREEAVSNFYYVQLKDYRQLQETLKNISKLSEYMEAIYQQTKSCESAMTEIQDEDVLLLKDWFDQIAKEYEEHNAVEEQNSIGKFFAVNSRIDEERYRESVRQGDNEAQRRVIGIPLYEIVNKMSRKQSLTLEDIFASIFREIDYGRGSIVPHHFSKNGVYTSLMHAGEENYRYYVNNYLPVLYGLCLLEFRGNGKVDEQQRLDYWDEFYATIQRKDFLPSDREYLVKRTTLESLQKVIEKEALYCSDRVGLEAAINLAKNKSMVVTNEQK